MELKRLGIEQIIKKDFSKAIDLLTRSLQE